LAASAPVAGTIPFNPRSTPMPGRLRARTWIVLRHLAFFWRMAARLIVALTAFLLKNYEETVTGI
jgi:hypothetical protein